MDEILPKCYVFGMDSVGKTEIINKFKENIEVREKESSFVPITRSNGALLDVEIIEIPIGEENKMLLSRFNAFIAVYDVTNKSSFDSISEIINKSQPKQKIKIFSNLIIVGNKIDLIEQRRISSDNAKKFAESVNATFLECSAKLKEGIEEIFTTAGTLASKIGPKSDTETSKLAKEIIDGDNEQENKQKKCC